MIVDGGCCEINVKWNENPIWCLKNDRAFTGRKWKRRTSKYKWMCVLCVCTYACALGSIPQYFFGFRKPLVHCLCSPIFFFCFCFIVIYEHRPSCRELNVTITFRYRTLSLSLAHSWSFPFISLFLIKFFIYMWISKKSFGLVFSFHIISIKIYRKYFGRKENKMNKKMDGKNWAI